MNYKFTSEQNLDVINKYLNTFTPIEKKFNTEMISVETEKLNNIVLHVGVGGFHRSHQAFTIHKSNEFLDKKDKWGMPTVVFETEIKCNNLCFKKNWWHCEQALK